MKIKYFQVIIIGLIVILFINFIVIAVPTSHAQSSQIWSDPINLSNAGSSTNPSFVIDLEGVFHVVWFDQFEGYKYTRSTDGVDWVAPKAVRFPFSPASLKDISQPEVPVLLVDDKGGIHALWQEKTDTEGTTALYYSKMSTGSDLTSSWTTRMKLADSVMDFDAVISTQGILHVGYVSGFSKNSSNPVGVFYRQLKGTSWSSSTNLYFSQYFRSLRPEEANVRLAVSDENETETVYLVWDDRPQKRILLSKSLDGGKLWESAVQIRDSEDGSNQGMPYNVNVGVIDSNLLLLWQQGQPGSQCSQYSQWSTDGGEQFGPPEKILDDIVGCPQASHFITVNKDFSVVSLKILDDIALVAWNGSRWSRPQYQEITTFINPLTFDSVIFGCQQIASYNGQLFVVGCDKGNGGDIWFSSRLLGDIENWFPPVTAWTVPAEITQVNQQIAEFSLVSDNENIIHAFWVQAKLLGGNKELPTIQHAEWNGEGWSNPATIISGMDGRPLQLKVYADSYKRLLLAWVDSKTGEMFFSWSESDRASITSEWVTPQMIPSTSQTNNSPDILVDGSGRIIVVYAIPINEQRGIYFVESDDGGKAWTKPVQVFDAASAGWDIVDQPQIGLTGDGRLHVLFKRYSFQGEPRRSLGLYYSQSANGGITWSNSEKVSENPVLWSGIVGYDSSILYRLWQEYTQSTLVSFHQISHDGGLTWNRPIIVSSINTDTSLTAQTKDRTGNLHFLQLTGEGNLLILNHMWDGSRWISQEPKELYIKDQGVPSSITAEVSSQGNLLVSVLVDYPYLTDESKSSIICISKSLGLPEEIPTSSPSFIATVEPAAVKTQETTDILQSPTQVPSVSDLSDSSPFLSKSQVGLLLLGGILVLLSIIFWPIFRNRDNPKKRS